MVLWKTGEVTKEPLNSLTKDIYSFPYFQEDGSEFFACHTCFEQATDHRNYIRYLGTRLHDISFAWGDNEGMVNSATIKHWSYQCVYDNILKLVFYYEGDTGHLFDDDSLFVDCYTEIIDNDNDELAIDRDLDQRFMIIVCSSPVNNRHSSIYICCCFTTSTLF